MHLRQSTMWTLGVKEEIVGLQTNAQRLLSGLTKRREPESLEILVLGSLCEKPYNDDDELLWLPMETKYLGCQIVQ